MTYGSGGCKTAVDYVSIRSEERQMVRNITVIQCEACIPQHNLCSETEGECEEEEGGIC